MSLPEELRGPRLGPPRSIADQVGGWLERHAQTLVASAGRLARAPFATVLTVGVIGLGLALPACLRLVVVNARSVTAGLEETVQVSVYLKPGLAPEQARRAERGIAARNDVIETTLVTPEEGLKELEARAGFGDALKALEANPLPWAIMVRPAPQFDSPAAVETLVGELKSLPDVELVQVDTEWVRRLEAILEALRRIVVVAAGLLALGVVAIVGNTIRLDINSRRDEIEVTKLVGGSNAFVRRPFLYSGTWYGLAGGLAAWGLVAAVVALLAPAVETVATLYSSGFRLAGLDGPAVGLLVGGGTLLGWLGSWVTASYHLRRIEPRA
jgi:cell division transport system permease protein